MSTLENNRIKKFDIRLVLRVMLLVILDILVINVSSFMALYLRYEFDYSMMVSEGWVSNMIRWMLPNTLLCLAVFVSLRLYSSLWGFAGADELLRIGVAAGIAMVVEFSVVLTGLVMLPRSFPILFAMILFIMVTCIRFFYRIITL